MINTIFDNLGLLITSYNIFFDNLNGTAKK